MRADYPSNNANMRLIFSEDGKRVYGDVNAVLHLQNYIYRAQVLSGHLNAIRKRRERTGGVPA